VHIVGFIIRRSSIQFIFVLRSWTVSTWVTRQTRSLHYFSLIFNFVIVFRKNTDCTSTYMKWANPRFTQQNVNLLLVLATHFQSISCKFTVEYNLYFGQDEISCFFLVKSEI